MVERAEGGIDVSVIVAVRNGAGTLAQCIDSVLTQTGCHVELIIVDAMSDDGTREIVESYGNAVVSYIREADRGIYDAWNKALAVARGDWCSFLGADDCYLQEQSVATLLRCAGESAGTPVFVFCGVLRTGRQRTTSCTRTHRIRWHTCGLGGCCHTRASFITSVRYGLSAGSTHRFGLWGTSMP